jgi:hypothetical protein
MFPKYQQATLDEENRAKKRVIESLAKAFLNETVSLDVNSSDTAVQIYDKLETKLNLFNALNSEAQTYFACSVSRLWMMSWIILLTDGDAEMHRVVDTGVMARSHNIVQLFYVGRGWT